MRFGRGYNTPLTTCSDALSADAQGQVSAVWRLDIGNRKLADLLSETGSVDILTGRSTQPIHTVSAIDYRLG